MKRTVILTVPEGVDDYVVTFTGPDPSDPDGYGQIVDAKKPPLPTDDQLTRDLDEVTHALKKRTGLSPEREDMALFDACRRVRAVAGLDENE